MVLGDCEETITTTEVDEDTMEEMVKVRLILLFLNFSHVIAL